MGRALAGVDETTIRAMHDGLRTIKANLKNELTSGSRTQSDPTQAGRRARSRAGGLAPPRRAGAAAAVCAAQVERAHSRPLRASRAANACRAAAVAADPVHAGANACAGPASHPPPRAAAAMRRRPPRPSPSSASVGSARFVMLVVIPLVALALGFSWWLSSGRYVSTDNAYVGADKSLITPAGHRRDRRRPCGRGAEGQGRRSAVRHRSAAL